jgi:hypothetical protein
MGMSRWIGDLIEYWDNRWCGQASAYRCRNRDEVVCGVSIYDTQAGEEVYVAETFAIAI